jgi:hypothetical protein
LKNFLQYHFADLAYIIKDIQASSNTCSHRVLFVYCRHLSREMSQSAHGMTPAENSAENSAEQEIIRKEKEIRSSQPPVTTPELSAKRVVHPPATAKVRQYLR